MKEYRNAIRSKRMIREAFAELVHEKQDMKSITVKELIERADVSKSTFYAHYQDIMAVAEDFEDDILEVLDDTLEEYIRAHTDVFFPYIQRIIDELKKREDLFKKLLCPDLPSSFFDNFKELCVKKINKDIKLKGLSKDPNMRYAQIDIIASGFLDLIVDYLHGKLNISLDEIGDLANELLLQLVNEK